MSTHQRNAPTQALRIARIDALRCIGCTKCIDACPFDAIIGARRRMHTVVEALCIGCELCVAPCPVDCIEMRAVEPARMLTREEALAARARREARRARVMRDAPAPYPPPDASATGDCARAAILQTVLRRAREHARERQAAREGERHRQRSSKGPE